MYNWNYFLVIGSVLIIAMGQIIFKYAAQKMQLSHEYDFLRFVNVNAVPLKFVALALALYCVSTVAWIYALRSIPLSIAFAFNALAFVIVPVAGFLIFDEAIPKYFVVGVFLIISGLFLISA